MNYPTTAIRAELDQRFMQARALAREGGVYLVQSYVEHATGCDWCDCPGKLLHEHAPEDRCDRPPIREMRMFTIKEELVFGACERHWPIMVRDMATAIRSYPHSASIPIGMLVLDVDPGDLRPADPRRN